MVDLTGIDLDAFVHRWSEPRVTGYGFAWTCPDCQSVQEGMPPNRKAVCNGRLLAEIVVLRAQVEALKEGAGSLHKAYARGREDADAAAAAFLRARRDRLTSADIRGKFDRAATDIENGAHRV